MGKVFLVDIEPVESRYTYYWRDHIQNMLFNNVPNMSDVVLVDGEMEMVEATEGAFLNFNATNIYKSNQVKKLVNHIESGYLTDGDVVLFCDAWHPGIINLRYMLDLNDINAEIHSIWHAGSYDPQDFLGRKVRDKNWSFNAERAFYFASDKSYFATYFHLTMMHETLRILPDSRSCVTGFPMEYISTIAEDYDCNKKENLICFPHRIAPEKNVDLFKEVMKHLPEYDYVICQEQKMTKHEYYSTLAKSKFLFSANKQETLGIGTMEGMMFGACPIVPDRLSYTEMYPAAYKYSYDKPEEIAKFIRDREVLQQEQIQEDCEKVFENFFCGDMMYKTINNSLETK